jgi:hypothetical protein
MELADGESRQSGYRTLLFNYCDAKEVYCAEYRVAKESPR